MTNTPITSASPARQVAAAADFAARFLNDGSGIDGLTRLDNINKPTGSNALLHIDLLTTLRENVETAIAERVDMARSAGRSWQEIASNLGVSRQAAQQRYGAHD
jgi:hypothetical protein